MSRKPPLRVPVVRVAGAEDLPLPTRVTPGAAGLDLPAAVDGDCVLAPGARELVPTGFRLALPEGYEGRAEFSVYQSGSFGRYREYNAGRGWRMIEEGSPP